MKLKHGLAAQFTSAALVGLAGIGETVAEHPLSFGQGRQNLFINMLGAVGKHQGQLCQGREPGSAGMEQHGAQFVSQRGASGLPRRDYINAAPAQVLCQLAKLGALAYPIETFKSNEFAALPGSHSIASGTLTAEILRQIFAALIS